MRNDNPSKINRIILLAEKLPYFSLDDLAPIEPDKTYLKVLLYRYEKSGKIYRLKKGIYVTKNYINSLEISQNLKYYPDFLANVLYQPAYLSLDYILYANNLLTEIPTTITAITSNKTKQFTNRFGTFYYHSIKDNLFCGYDVENTHDFTIYKATKAKALFDFLYLRKNILSSPEAIRELRINTDNITNKDKSELKSYLKLDKSKKLKNIINFLLE